MAVCSRPREHASYEVVLKSTNVKRGQPERHETLSSSAVIASTVTTSLKKFFYQYYVAHPRYFIRSKYFLKNTLCFLSSFLHLLIHFLLNFRFGKDAEHF